MKTKNLAKFIVVVALGVLVAFIACGKKTPTKSSLPVAFETSFNRCTDRFPKMGKVFGGTVVVTSFNDTIRVEHINAFYKSCADIKVDVEKTRNGYDLFEKYDGDTTCTEKCDFDIVTLIYHLTNGTYLIKLYDIEHQLIFQDFKIVQIKDDEEPPP